jgi:hypothetical protein
MYAFGLLSGASFGSSYLIGIEPKHHRDTRSDNHQPYASDEAHPDGPVEYVPSVIAHFANTEAANTAVPMDTATSTVL